MKRELVIISGEVARDHVRLRLAHKPHQSGSQILQWFKGISSRWGSGIVSVIHTTGNGVADTVAVGKDPPASASSSGRPWGAASASSV